MNDIIDDKKQNQDIAVEHTDERDMTVGEILRNARTMGRRKREIATIAKQLCIAEEFLQALEDGNYKKIPEIVYILGFARNYAMELGLNPDDIVARVKNELGIVTESEVTITNDDLVENAQENFGDKFGAWLSKTTVFVRKHFLWFGIGFFVLISAIVLLIAFGGQKEPEVTIAEQMEQVVTDIYADEPVYNIPVRERFGLENKEKSTMILQAIEDTYIKVEDGRGKVIFGRSMVAGDIFYIPGDGKAVADFGNGGGIDIWVDGVLAPRVGPAHIVKKGVLLSPDKLLPQETSETDVSDKK